MALDLRRGAVALVLALALVAGACAHTANPTGGLAAIDRSGTLPDGALWHLQVPKGWTGTLVVYGHGLVSVGQPNPATTAPDAATARALLSAGYALVGTSYKTTGWDIQDALADQTAVIDVFAHSVGAPHRTIAVGSSLGALITTTLLERSPERFDGGVALCGVIWGTAALWSSVLDPMFVLATLLPSVAEAGPLVHTAQSAAQGAAVRDQLVLALRTPAGQARIALAYALGGLPAPLTPAGRAVVVGDSPSPIEAQAINLAAISFLAFDVRAELEARAGGNPSSNVGVDYTALLRGSPDLPDLQARYRAAGLSLDGDLAALAAAPRISADPAAVRYAQQYVEPTGQLADPLLTVGDLGDPLALPGYTGSYAARVAAAGHADLIRESWLHRGTHCIMSPAEVTAAVQALDARIQTGQWGTLADPDALNQRAKDLGAAANVILDAAKVVASGPQFVAHVQGPLPRPAGA